MQTLITNTYGANNGNLTSSTYGNGQVINYTYDNLNRLIGKNNGTNTLFNWVYDAAGNLGIYKDYVNGVNYRYTYDLANRLVKLTGDNGHSVAYSYDKNNNVSQLIQKLGSNSYTTSYTTDSDSQQKTLSLGLSGGDRVTDTYDGLCRESARAYRTGTSTYNYLTGSYSYTAGTNGNTTTLLSGLSYASKVGGTTTNGPSFAYTYDDNGNIATISEGGVQKVKYTYDELNQLVREDNKCLAIPGDSNFANGKTVTYAYDLGGNLTSKNEYAYTETTLGAVVTPHAYAYGDNNWKDKLTSYDGNAITYDAIGNPVNYYNGYTYTWQNGRQLASASNGTNSVSYTYNADGIRTSKTVNGATTNYYLEGGSIAWQTDGTNTIHYTYDQSGQLVYMTVGTGTNLQNYYYLRNGQNDIIGLVDSNMNTVVTYAYDSWGKPISMTDNSGSGIGTLNPFRYRGYYYDTETGLYYLNSRYYDANTGRMLNADSVVTGTGKTVQGYNLFAYCFNNPIVMSDESGHWPTWNQIFAVVAVVAIVAVVAVVSVATVGVGTTLIAAGVGATIGVAGKYVEDVTYNMASGKKG